MRQNNSQKIRTAFDELLAPFLQLVKVFTREARGQDQVTDPIRPVDR